MVVEEDGLGLDAKGNGSTTVAAFREFTSSILNGMTDLVTEMITANMSQAMEAQEKPGPPIQKYMSVTIGCVGILGNGLAMLTLGSSATLRKKTVNRFILNQSFIDFLTAILLMATALTLPYKEPLYGISGILFCYLWDSTVILWCLFVTSSCNLLVMTTERYLKIVHPFWYRKSVFTRHCIMGMIAAWLFGFIFNLLLTVPTTFIDEGNICRPMTLWPSVTVQRIAGIITVAVEYFIPILILFFCYLRIIFALRTQMDPGESNMASNASSVRDDILGKALKNTMLTLALVAFFFVVCWTGNQIYFFMYNLGIPMCWCGSIYYAEINLAYLNCVINPFIYVFTYRPFQIRLMEMLGFSSPKEHENSSKKTSTTNVCGKISTISV